MPRNDRVSLWHTLATAQGVAGRVLTGRHDTIALEGLISGTSLGGRLPELRGRSVLLAVKDQLTAALALIELDGVARRIVLCPPDLALEHVRPIAETAEIDAIVADQPAIETLPDTSRAPLRVLARSSIAAGASGASERGAEALTEWILLTSGTTGVPKLVAHTLASLAGPVSGSPVAGNRPVWSTFYDIRRYGGLQIFLRAVLGGGSMTLSDKDEPTADFLSRAGASGVTHISGTPSHWRRALMSPNVRAFRPGYVRLSGEIADQGVLDNLRQCFPQSSIAHAFASTEAGVAFDVSDGRAGFPAALLERSSTDVEMKIEGGSLRIRSGRTASRYLDRDVAPLRDADGFVDTGDMVERVGDRYYFAGRRGGIINVGGAKVHPEEVEAVINRHPAAQMAIVRARKSPITGAVVVADVVLRDGTLGSDQLKVEILEMCRAALPAHKVPAIIRIVASIEVAPSGKLERRHG